ncbi:hypothetical protein N7481_007854 [Penicillium waksmanii]|uniref:uncharacterized protein n=1 Tax=Penicillium waksmanii TaxID=69791 RepID=UPI002547D334|nr:uncharacterized protein N7481_007854 [Penicillium waksmanii]KAJ5980556.1 hypothetical protein N7481_007854 [Penicillium waksmanii]
MDLSTTPGMQPPAGQTSHFNGSYSSLQIGTVISFGVTFFIATCFLGLRVFQAVKLIKNIELDLITIIISYGVSATYFATIVNQMKWGWGKHMWNVSLADLMEFNKVRSEHRNIPRKYKTNAEQGLLPNTLTYLICPAITKMAIVSVLFRINPSVIYRCIVVAVAVSIFAYTLVLCTIVGGPCNPLKTGTTACLENVALAQSVLNIASDIAVIALPIPTIHALHLSTKNKITVGCLLTLGSGVIVCSIARLPYVLLLDKTEDVTYTEAILGIWSMVEINLGIVCACAMRMKRLIATYLPRLSLFSSNPSNTAKTSHGSDLRRFQPNGRGQHSYQLHSLQGSSVDPLNDPKGIKYHQSFKVDVQSKDGGGGDAASTDKILI